MSSATAYGDASESGVEAPSVAVSQLLGPESVTWNYFGDWRGMLMGLWQGSMQNLHPKLGAAVWEYSDFFGERWQRVFRSLYPIMGVVFDQTPATGAEVRDYHRTIKGTLPDGSRYHALDPDVFYWAHATFWYGNIRCARSSDRRSASRTNGSYSRNPARGMRLTA